MLYFGGGIAQKIESLDPNHQTLERWEMKSTNSQKNIPKIFPPNMVCKIFAHESWETFFFSQAAAHSLPNTWYTWSEEGLLSSLFGGFQSYLQTQGVWKPRDDSASNSKPLERLGAANRLLVGGGVAEISFQAEMGWVFFRGKGMSSRGMPLR